MPSPCAFEGCRMTKEISRVIGLNISFFQIPKNESLRKQWISKCKPKVNLKHSLVCSLHFEEKDFERDLKAELLNLKPKLLLKKTAIPTKKGETVNQEINNQINEVQDNNTKDVIAITDQQKEIDSHVITDIIEDVQDGNITTILLNNTIETSDHQEQTKRHIQSVETQSSIKNIEIIDYQEVTYSSINNVEVPPANIEIEITDYQEEIESTETHSANRGIENRVSDLQIEVSQLREENYKLKRKLTRKQKIILRQRRQNNNLSQVIRNFKLKQNKEAKKVVDQIIRNKLTDVFTSKQLDKILTKKQVRWTDEDISIAFTLRYLSKPCYLYLRNSLNYPLPGETTIHSWCSKVNMD